MYQANLWWRSAIYSVLIIIGTVVHGTLCLLAAPLPLHLRYRFTRLWMIGVIYCGKKVCGIEYKIIGWENTQTIKNGIIFSKHQSAWETIVLAAMFQQAALIIKRELLWIPFFGWGLALLSPIAINRSKATNALQQLLGQGMKLLSQGRWIIIFPEGSRVEPGKVGRYHLGGAKLAVTSGYPVIPVAHNAGICWGKRKFIKSPGVIKVIFGPPIYPQGLTAQEVLHTAKTWIEQTMEQL